MRESKLGAGRGRTSPPPPPNRYPVEHPLWDSFVTWVETSSVVSRTLLERPEGYLSSNDWRTIWLTYLAGSSSTTTHLT